MVRWNGPLRGEAVHCKFTYPECADPRNSVVQEVSTAGAYSSRRTYGMKKSATRAPLIVMTIGHSTHPIREFIHLLKAHHVQRLVDVRPVPRPRHNPQFNRRQLSSVLHSARLHYRYMPGLGGFRHARSAEHTSELQSLRHLVCR